MPQSENRPLVTHASRDLGPTLAEPLPAREVELDTSPLPEHEVVTGNPSAGSRTLRAFDEVEVGIWEMTPGSARDVEADEVFVVVSGTASIRFDDGRETSLRPGDVMSLFEGQRTVWTVTETLRKVYIMRSGKASPE